tara:strand:+ start:694 stop:1089 length:396 start_codon:yes stop_codon:yes gene_type:complete
LKKKKYEKEFNKKKFEDRRKVIEKYLDEVTVKLIDKTYKRKVYEIVIKLNYTLGEDRRCEFKLGVGVDNSPNQYNNPMGYKLGYELAQRGISNYNQLSKFSLILIYNYKTFSSVRTKNKRKIIRVELPSYY